MALTLAALIQEARSLIFDINPLVYEFSDAQITDFINQAIRDLSQKFPRSMVYTITTTADTRVYDLETVHTGILSVEYPTGATPPRYLIRRSSTHPHFWRVDGYYDLIKPGDATSLNPPQLAISQKPAAGEVITLRLSVEHALLADAADECSVPERNLHLIGLFVRWKCWQAIATREGMDPDTVVPMSATFELNAERSGAAYYTHLAAAAAAEAESAISPWTLDKYDRRY